MQGLVLAHYGGIDEALPFLAPVLVLGALVGIGTARHQDHRHEGDGDGDGPEAR